MLTIERCDVEETISIGELFDQLEFPNLVEPTDESGDSVMKNDWGIDVQSERGYFPIEAFRWTKPERQVQVHHRALLMNVDECLQCSPEHLVRVIRHDCLWVRVGDLTTDDLIVTDTGLHRVTGIKQIDSVERLCDLQVKTSHSYYISGVLSHNSHMLTFFGANALRNNINVLHYTMELSEEQIGRRYDSYLCDIDSNDVIDKKDEILKMYDDMKLGRLKIKYFPTSTATIYTLRSHIERLSLAGFVPGLIIIDYADIMRSTRQFDSLRHELKLIYEELRGYGGELRIPIWTASQSNKEGSSSDIIDLSNMSEAYGKAMVADVVLGLSRKPHEKAEGHGRLYIAKNRAGRDGLIYQIKIDTAKSNFEIRGQAARPDEVVADDEKNFKRALREKWKEIQEDQVLSKDVA